MPRLICTVLLSTSLWLKHRGLPFSSTIKIESLSHNTIVSNWGIESRLCTHYINDLLPRHYSATGDVVKFMCA